MKIQEDNVSGDIAVSEKRLNEFDYNKAEIDKEAEQEVLKVDIIDKIVDILLGYAIDFYNDKLSEIELSVKVKSVLEKASCSAQQCEDLIKWLLIYKPSRFKLIKAKLEKELSKIIKTFSVYVEEYKGYNRYSYDFKTEQNQQTPDYSLFRIRTEDLKTVIDQIIDFTNTHNKNNLNVVYKTNSPPRVFHSLKELESFLEETTRDGKYKVSQLFTNHKYNEKYNKFEISINIEPTFKNPISDYIRSMGESTEKSKSDIVNDKSVFSFQSKNRIITIEGFSHEDAQKIAIKLMAPFEKTIELPEGEYKLIFNNINK